MFSRIKTNVIYISSGKAVLKQREFNKPIKDKVLIETKACGICMGDIYAFQGKLSGGQPFGHEGVGIVKEVGEDVHNFKPGDKVTSLGWPAFAESYIAEANTVSKIPDDVENYAIWISEPIACVVNGIRGSEIQIGENVCIIGCGYMGLLIVQGIPKNIIKNLYVIDIKKRRLELAKKFGADVTIEVTKEMDSSDVQNIVGDKMDTVIEASGIPGTINQATDLVKEGGKLIIFGRHVVDEKLPTEKWHNMGLRVLNTAPSFSQNFTKDFQDGVALIKKGTFDQKLLITHRFNFNDPQSAFEKASEKSDDYIKGAIVFQ